MIKKDFNIGITDFITNSTCSFTCVKEIKKRLLEKNFQELLEQEKWHIKGTKFFIVRNDASIIAIELPENRASAFSIITTHCDTPSLLLKPSGAYVKENYLKYNIMPYGGLLNYGWLDHPLSLAGRIITSHNNKLHIKIIDFKEPLFIVPSVPIHQNDKANTNLDLNMQLDLQPICALSKDTKTWQDFLNRITKDKIIDYDLFAYNVQKPIFIGNKNELLVSPRIDNLTSVYSALESFLDSKSSNIKVFCSFNNEEIGSLTEEGADSNFLLDILKRIASHIDIDISSALANSFIISSDNTHAIHPNHTEYADDTGVAYLGGGVAIIKEVNSTTNGITSSVIKEICYKHNIRFQDSTAKNDITGGSTLSGISLRHVSVLSIDVGIAQLAMHSSIETCSSDDIYELYKLMHYFYETKLIRSNKKIEII